MGEEESVEMLEHVGPVPFLAVIRNDGYFKWECRDCTMSAIPSLSKQMTSLAPSCGISCTLRR